MALIVDSGTPCANPIKGMNRDRSRNIFFITYYRLASNNPLISEEDGLGASVKICFDFIF